MNTTTTSAAEITWTSPTGKAVTLSVVGHTLTVAVAGVTDGVKTSIYGGKVLETAAPAVARDFGYALSADVVFGGTARRLFVGIPAVHAAAALAMLDAAEAARPKSRQEQYNALEAAWLAAKDKAEQAREAAYGRDTGAGFDRVRELDAAAEAARLACVSFGDLHQAAVDGNTY